MPTIQSSRKAWFKKLRLSSGAHEGPRSGACVIEAAAYLAGEPWSDHPACVSPVIAAFLRRWNDDLDDAGRQMLKPYALQVVGTASTQEAEARRAWLVTDWMVREYTPAWLDLAGCVEQATALRGLPEITPVSASAAQPTIETARGKAAAAWDAAGGAARAAARDAARDAAGGAARAAAWDAARDAAGDALKPAIKPVQKSALALLDRMIGVSK
jgi:hypothetical protein